MEDLIKLLDENLEVDTYEVIDDEIFIYTKSIRTEATCPYCGHSSSKVHSFYTREFKDLPISGKKSNIILKNRKFFCNNSDCKRKTFAEAFDFLGFKAKKTKRLKEYIINISQNTSSLAAERMLKENVVQVRKNGGAGKKHKSKLDIYKETIISLLEDGVNGSTIYKRIKEKGYEGSSSLVRTFIAELRKGNSNELGILKEKVLRRSLISLLYKEIDSVKDITKDQLNKILNIYPELKIIYDIAKDFKSLLFSKREFDLENWIKRAKTLNIKELNSFISGIERDLEAVKNSIKYEFSNGLAEGTANKIKVIKRIMYGRCSFELFRKKVLLQNFN